MVVEDDDRQEEFVVVGDRVRPMRDIYHAFLRWSWTACLALIVGVFLATNALFAVAYLVVGGIHGATPGSFTDAMFFSVQTMGTIGYGGMYPETVTANVLVVAEAVTGLLFTSLAAGLVFAKFAHARTRIVFSRRATVTLVNGVPTLAFRIGHERGHPVIGALIRLTMSRSETTLEGSHLYRFHDLTLSRERVPELSRSWTVMCPLDATCPLHGVTPEQLRSDEVELWVTVSGTDSVTAQPVVANHRYDGARVLFGMRHRDLLEVVSERKLLVHISRFHDLEPTEPTDAFPYGKGRCCDDPAGSG